MIERERKRERSERERSERERERERQSIHNQHVHAIISKRVKVIKYSFIFYSV